jgi:Glycosyltransferase WbsX
MKPLLKSFAVTLCFIVLADIWICTVVINNDSLHLTSVPDLPLQLFPASQGVWTRLASSRCKHIIHKSNHTFDRVLPSTAVFAQLLDFKALDVFLKCILNTIVSASANGKLDIYICLPPPENLHTAIIGNITIKPFVRNVYAEEYKIGENEALIFLRQLNRAASQNHNYTMVLRLHSNFNDEKLTLNSEAMCGTPEQVTSIFNSVLYKGVDSMYMVLPKSSLKNISNVDKKKYNYYVERYFTSWPLIIGNHQLDSGGMYWISWDALNRFRLIPKINGSNYLESDSYFPKFFDISLTDYAIRNRILVTEIFPAPRILAFFFPQFYEIPENNKFWGKGFTEWTWLRPSKLKHIKKPLKWKKGGLGYYNLTSPAVRRRQGRIAQRFGLSGFVYYHYWFHGKNAPKNHKVMFEALELMLKDGYPDMPFMLSWANEPWDRHWTGGVVQDVSNEILLEQKYGNQTDWMNHFCYLYKFFRNENYIKLEGKPVLIIYRIGHIGEYFVEMMSLWRKMSIEMGFPGIHVIETIGSSYKLDASRLELERYVDAALHFWPAAHELTIAKKTASSENLHVHPMSQYWGAFVGFDKRIRDKTAKYYPFSATSFELALKVSFQDMSQDDMHFVKTNYYFVTAWNEWNEQAVLEPNSKDKFAYLISLLRVLENLPVVHPPIMNKACRDILQGELRI